MKIIIIFGPPGSGKGTQAGMLAEKFKFKHVSTGKIFREEIANRTEIGKIAETFIDKGNLVPDKIVCKLVEDFLVEHKKGKGLIFDGFPRTLKQAEIFESFLKDKKIADLTIINLAVDNKELMKRLLKRAKIEGRNDDTKETIKVRLDVYRNQTEPILTFYKGKERILDINGLGEIDDIHSNILKCFN